jgi:hypothetical protein
VALALEGCPSIEINCQRRIFSVSPDHGRWHHTLLGIPYEHWTRFATNLIQSAIWDERTNYYCEFRLRNIWIPDGVKHCPVYGIELHGTHGSYYFRYEKGWTMWSGGGCAPYPDFVTFKRPQKQEINLNDLTKRLLVTDNALAQHPYITACQDSYEAAEIEQHLQSRLVRSVEDSTFGAETEKQAGRPKERIWNHLFGYGVGTDVD